MNNNTSCDQNNIIYNSFAPLQKYNIKRIIATTLVTNLVITN